MKYLIIILLSFSAVAQADSISRSNISVISAERLNVVYRGIDNPIKIAVPGAVSFAVSAPGIKRGTGQGNYILNPGQGNEVNVMISATMPDGKFISEEKTFRVLGLPAPTGVLNDDMRGSYVMTKDDLAKATVGIGMENFLFDVNFKVTSFTLSLPSNRTNIVIDGNMMDGNAIRIIHSLKPKALVVISNIRFGNPETCQKSVSNILVEITK